MKRCDVRSLVLLAGFLGALPAAASGQGPKTKPAAWTPQLMMQVKKIGRVEVSPDGKRVVFAVREAVMEGNKSEYLTHLHLANADGSETMQLTQGGKSCDEPQWSPDGGSIAFLSSRSGKSNIWLIRSQGGEALQLTNVKSAVNGFKWSPDGHSIAFTAVDPLTPEEDKRIKEKNDARVVDENVKMSRLYVVSAKMPAKGKAKASLLTTKNYSIGGGMIFVGKAAFDWSPDSKSIVFCHTRTPQHDDWGTANLSVVDVAGGSVKSLVNTAAAEYSPLYSPDGRSIAYVASDNPPTWAGTGRVHLIAPAGGSAKPLAETPDQFGRYSELIGWSPDSQKIYFTEARGTVLTINALPLDGPPDRLSNNAGMASSGVSLNASRTMFGFAWETAHQPPEAYAFRPKHANFKDCQVSRVNRDLPFATLGHTETLRWLAHDGEIEGLLTYPAGNQPGKKPYPLLVIVHGGPMGVFTETFPGAAGLYPVAAFAQRGYAVLRPNPRGSSGYGKKFRYANYRDWGGGDFKDIMAGVDHVIRMGVADENRLGIMGWSYGGYMTSWTITQTQRFKAASVGAGVTNLMSFTGTADIPSFLPDYFRKEFWDDEDIYRKHSAMFHVKGVKTPTLIQHGEKDERVPLPQGQELYNALKRQGCPVKMVIYPRTPHGIEEPRLLLDCMERNLAWFDTYLGGSAK